ncbi:MAG TPA: tetratricopeptide repeat protein, partial [Anaerolineae bacterium]|nr:tetratricopeptide repeat protein [Anaerolineae bacterium]
MLCDSCGAEVEEDFTFCPHCGHKIGELERGRVAIFPTREQLFPHWVWLLGFALLIGCILMSVLGVGMAGVYGGLKERAVLARQQAEEHYNRGLAHLEEGDYNLAEAEFREALRLAPNYWEAADKLREVRAQATAMATPSPSPTVPLEVDSQSAAIYRQAQELYSRQNWIETALTLEQLRDLDPYYERENVTEMLFSSYYNMALDLVDKDRLEEALRSFDKALEVKPGDPEALVQRELVSTYLTGLGYWEADWVRAIESFLAIYRIDPEYKDVKQRLYEAYLNHGDLYASEEAWCLAEERYDQAAALDSNDDIIAKRDDAAYRCQIAVAPTPTIIAAVTPTATIAAAAAVTATVTPTVSIAAVGKIAFAAYDAGEGVYTIYMV